MIPRQSDIPDLTMPHYFFGGVPPGFVAYFALPQSFLGCMSDLQVLQEAYNPVKGAFWGVQRTCSDKVNGLHKILNTFIPTIGKNGRNNKVRMPTYHLGNEGSCYCLVRCRDLFMKNVILQFAPPCSSYSQYGACLFIKNSFLFLHTTLYQTPEWYRVICPVIFQLIPLCTRHRPVQGGTYS